MDRLWLIIDKSNDYGLSWRTTRWWLVTIYSWTVLIRNNQEVVHGEHLHRGHGLLPPRGGAEVSYAAHRKTLFKLMHSICLCLTVHRNSLSIYLSVCLSIYISNLPTNASIYQLLSMFLPSICLCLSLSLSIHPSVCPSIYHLTYQCTSLSVH